MINNTFAIVARESDFSPFETRTGRDRWGWEVVDATEMDYAEASRLRKEYQLAMPSHVVRIRATQIETLRVV